MKFAEKKKAYQAMQDPAHLCCDRELLEKKAPKSPALSVGIVDKAKAQREILWELLEVATVEEIESYRKPTPNVKIDYVVGLSNLINNPIPSTKEDLKICDDLICELIDSIEKEGLSISDELQDKVSEVKKQLSSAMVKIQFIEKLMAVDLKKATQPQMASIARGLKLETPNYTAATLRIVLDDYRFSLSLQSKKNESHSDQVIDQMNADTDSSIVELEEKVETLELENEDLQEQLDDAEAEKELLEEQLEEEKKSEATQDPE